MQDVQARASDLDIQLLDKKIDQMMPELGFTAEDNDRLVASYRRAPGLVLQYHCCKCSAALEARVRIYGERA